MLYNAYLNIITYKKVNYITYSALYGTNLNQNKMKTAIEWLVEQIKQNVHNSVEEFELLVDKTKEMEKQQIINPLIALGWTIEKAEQYYNETFKSE